VIAARCTASGAQHSADRFPRASGRHLARGWLARMAPREAAMSNSPRLTRHVRKKVSPCGIHSRARSLSLTAKQPPARAQLRASHSCGIRGGRSATVVHGSFVREKCGGACIASTRAPSLALLDSRARSETQSMSSATSVLSSRSRRHANNFSAPPYGNPANSELLRCCDELG